VALEKLPYRSIQVGVGRGMVKEWVEEMIVAIEVCLYSVCCFSILGCVCANVVVGCDGEGKRDEEVGG
jgi:hypothetical protein